MKHLSLISLPSVNGETKTTSEIEKLHVKVEFTQQIENVKKHAKNFMNFLHKCYFILINLKSVKLLFIKNVFLDFLVDPSSLRKPSSFAIIVVKIVAKHKTELCCTRWF